MSSPEQLPQSGERGLESAGDAARERAAELLNTPEQTAERPERSGEALEKSARKEALENAISKDVPGKEQSTNAPQQHRVQPRTSRQAKDKAYATIMQHTQAELSPASRAFSKVIHQPVIEKTSAVVGSTVARPNAILFGALFALIISGGIYLVARYYGYSLSGFEAIGAFCVGWAIGMIIDFVRLAVRKH